MFIHNMHLHVHVCAHAELTFFVTLYCFIEWSSPTSSASAVSSIPKGSCGGWNCVMYIIYWVSLNDKNVISLEVISLVWEEIEIFLDWKYNTIFLYCNCLYKWINYSTVHITEYVVFITLRDLLHSGVFLCVSGLWWWRLAQ